MAMRGRAGTVSVATVGVIASLKPRPPSSPRSSLTDVTNGAAGLLSGKGGSSDGEVARLSDKILSLMSQIHARDEQVRKLEESLALARREAGNAKNLLATGGKITTPASDASLDDATARARVAAPRPTTGTSRSPGKDVQLRVLSGALREADMLTAMKSEELAAARSMLVHRPQGGGGSSSSSADGPAPGVVARLQAELAEAAEERRSLRQQLQVMSLVLASDCL